jgi:hypothetical protein
MPSSASESNTAWGTLATGATAAGLVLLGAVAAGMRDVPLLIGATIIAFLIGLVGKLRHQRHLVERDLQAAWEQSLRKFRDNLTAFTAHIRSALQTTGQDVLPGGMWEDVASKARWPEMDDQPVRGWKGRKAAWLTEAERKTLEVAQFVEASNAIPCHFKSREVISATRSRSGWLGGISRQLHRSSLRE